MKKIVALSLLAAFSLSGCANTPASSIVLAPESIQIMTADEMASDVLVGNTLQLVISSPTLGADLSVTWSVDVSEIASITENGLLTGLSRGVAVVSAVSTINTAVLATKSINVNRAPGYRIMDAGGAVVVE